MSVSSRLRYEVLRRDNHTCRYCGGTPPNVTLTVDHVTPVTLGGSDDPSNLVAACSVCNSGKSATPVDAALVANVDERAVRWAQAMQIAVERRSEVLAKERSRVGASDLAWSEWRNGDELVSRPAGWKSSVLRFLAGGLDDQFLVDAVGIAMGLDQVPPPRKWRYSRGICCREMDRIREIAVSVAEGEPSGTTDTERSAHMRIASQYPYMDMFEIFLEDVVYAMGGGLSVSKLVNDTLWDSIQESHHVYMDRSIAGDSSCEAARKAQGELATRSADAMVTLANWRNSQGVTT